MNLPKGSNAFYFFKDITAMTNQKKNGFGFKEKLTGLYESEVN
jgi:hypothetical protein